MAAPRFRQIHLSTALVLTAAAGVLLWLNLQPRLIEINSADGRPFWHEYGWPLVAYEEPTRINLKQELMTGTWFTTSLYLDVTVALALLFCTGIISEWFTRAGRRDPNAQRPWYALTRAAGLATLGVLAVIVYLNCLPHSMDMDQLPENLMMGALRGWPFGSHARGHVIFDPVDGVLGWPKQNLLFWKPFVANLGIAATLLAATAVLSERFFRGRAR